MKTFNKSKAVILVLSVLMVMTACVKKLDLNPSSTVNDNDVFSDLENAELAVLGAYAPLAGDAGYGIRLSLYYPSDNDETTMSTGAGQGGRGDLAHFGLISTNTELPEPFAQLYRGIERANLCIKSIPEMDEYSGTPDQQKKAKALLAESYAVRALYYLELIRTWGDVPAQFEPSRDQATLLIPNTDRMETLSRLIEDLKTAGDIAPWYSEAGVYSTRFTKGAIKGLRARLALYRAGWYADMTSGELKRKEDYLDYYKIARDECDEVMKSGQHSLNPSYEAIFKDGICAHKLEPQEMMYEVEMEGPKSTNSKMGYANGPKAQDGSGNGFVLALPNYFYLFDSTDVRRDVTLAPYVVGNTDATIHDIKPITGINALYEAKFRRDWIINPGYQTTQYNSLNWPIMRYSDILLMFAEAENELNGPANALPVLNQVRARAHVEPASAASKQEFFDLIVKERSLEFGGEGMRKYDLKRWGLLESKLLATVEIHKKIAEAVRDKQPYPAPYTNYPDAMYAKPVNGKLEYYNSFYQPGLSGTEAATAVSLGYSKISWMSALYSTNSPEPTGSGRAALYYNFAKDFKHGKSELFPYPVAEINTNPSVKQNFGY